MLNPVELNVFVMAAETENFSEAARRLGVTQPTVSVQIRSLEDRLGIALVDGTGGHVGIEDTMVSLQGEIVGLLQIGCTTASGKYVLPRILGELRKAHPRVEVQVRITTRHDALELLRSGDVQVAVTSLQEPAKDLDYRRFATDHIVLIAPPDHRWAHVRIRPADLVEGEFISREPGSGTVAAVREALAGHDLGVDDLPQIMELGNSEAIRIAVAEGIGVAFVSAMVATEAGRNEVAIVDIEGFHPERTLYMVRDSSRSATRAQAAFWDYAFSDETAALRDRITNLVVS